MLLLRRRRLPLLLVVLRAVVFCESQADLLWLYLSFAVPCAKMAGRFDNVDITGDGTVCKGSVVLGWIAADVFVDGSGRTGGIVVLG